MLRAIALVELLSRELGYVKFKLTTKLVFIYSLIFLTIDKNTSYMLDRVSTIGLLLTTFSTLLAIAVPPASAVSLTGEYFTLPASHPDVERGDEFLDGIDFEIVTGLVKPTLSANDLPIVSDFGRTYSGPSGPISDINADGEVLWWSSTSPYQVAAEKIQTDSLPFAFSNFYPDGFDNNSTFFRTVHWQGTFDLSSSTPVEFVLGADDDAFLFIDKQLVVDNGGVKPVDYTSRVVSNLSSGKHEIDLFFADRHTTGSDIQFSFTPVPEPSSILGVLAFGALSLGGVLKRKRQDGN